METPLRESINQTLLTIKKELFMKTTGILVLGILVILCFGLLWAFNGPGNNIPAPQDQQTMTSAIINADHQIDLGTAIRLIRNHKANLTVSSALNATKGGFFARSAFDKILAQPGVAGIRYYYAQNDNGTPTLILVGVDAKGQEMQTGAIMERALLCPPFCGSASELAQ
jgi:hypothetical protein